MSKCRDCKLFDLDATRDKAGRVRKDRVGRCMWVSREVWPVSVMEYLNKRPSTSYMQPDSGERCGRFIKREDQQ